MWSRTWHLFGILPAFVVPDCRDQARRTLLNKILQDESQPAADTIVRLPDDLRVDPQFFGNFSGALPVDGDFEKGLPVPLAEFRPNQFHCPLNKHRVFVSCCLFVIFAQRIVIDERVNHITDAKVGFCSTLAWRLSALRPEVISDLCPHDCAQP